MSKRESWASWATYTDRDASRLDPASERSIGVMLSAVRSDLADTREAFTPAHDAYPSFAADFPAVFSLADLNGINGFRLDGASRDDDTGASVSSAGDINGDGFDDVIIGGDFASQFTGVSYVVFGKADGFAARLDLGSLDGGNGFRIEGTSKYDQSGGSVSSAGDINGDGLEDIIIGASRAAESYVIFGTRAPFEANFDLATLDGVNGFRIEGIKGYDWSGFSVSDAGDVNGDGLDDIVIGAPRQRVGGENNVGESYVVFGHEGGFDATLDLASLDGTNGFRMIGINRFDNTGWSVSSAGDVNGDGFDDVLIGDDSMRPYAGVARSECYVVFGKAKGFDPIVDLGKLDGSDGFRVAGVEKGDNLGQSVSSVGDVNGDGYDDVIIGAHGTFRDAGSGYIVFGKASGFAPILDPATLDGTNGFRVNGINVQDDCGYSVSSAGDVNGDGFDDILIGAFRAGHNAAGESYIVFGHAGGFDANLDLGTLDGTNGVRIEGNHSGDYSGGSVSSAGDVNGDGFDDIIIGATRADPNGESSGAGYVLFGHAPDEAVKRVGSAADQTIRGGDFDDRLLGKGGDDVLAGAGGVDRLKGGAGADDFLLASRDASDADRILDFGNGHDRIALDGDVFGFSEGALGAGRFVIGEAAGDANDRLIYDDASGRLFFDADGTGAEAQVLIATLNGAPMLAASDIVVI